MIREDKIELRHGSWFEPLEDLKGKLMGVLACNLKLVGMNQSIVLFLLYDALLTNGNKQSEFLVDFLRTKWDSSFRDVEAV
ncbi:hypothetical protein GUJ93_ZPchr0012g19324 [Zizania palustris]|uniref:Uncharacterized protein n=1 Tax=Zizania palustris TaxID=103762 RepID=A0A8J6BTF0_ZIZPA|nr:hypothetical protein GUJ93_ZPchr0012g19324 [Zizania palustris]